MRKLLNKTFRVLVMIMLTLLWVGFMEVSIIVLQFDHPILHKVLGYVAITAVVLYFINLMIKEYRRRVKLRAKRAKLDVILATGDYNAVTEALAKISSKKAKDFEQVILKHKERINQLFSLDNK